VSQLEDAQQLPSEAVIDVAGIAQRRRDLSLLLMARIAHTLSVALPKLLSN
jgi:hypothetical protein